MNKSCIYIIRSICKPERFYIGSAVAFSRRKSVHLHHLRNNTHHSPKLQSHINKYGIHDIYFEVIELVAIENLISREQYYIDTLNPFFNISKVAGNSLGVKRSEETRKNQSELWTLQRRKIQSERSKGKRYGLGSKRSDEFKKKLSERCKGRIITTEQKQKQSAAMKGRVVSDATRLKISATTKGKIHSEQAIKLISKKLLGHQVSEETRSRISQSLKGKLSAKAKPVYDIATGKIYHSMSIACSELGLNYEAIRKHAAAKNNKTTLRYQDARA